MMKTTTGMLNVLKEIRWKQRQEADLLKSSAHAFYFEFSYHNTIMLYLCKALYSLQSTVMGTLFLSKPGRQI